MRKTPQDATPMIRPIGDRILVDIIDRGQTKINGLIIPDDDFKERGIKPRRGVVLALGPKANNEGIQIGDTVLMGHGDWTRSFDVPFTDGSLRRCWFTDESKVMMVL